MVWKLSDLCLQCIQQHLHRYPDLGCNLTTVHKEMLIDRLACHDLFFSDRLIHIKNHLFTSSLRHINLQRCPQITDQVLQLLGSSGCKLEVLILNKLESVTDAGIQAVTQAQDALLVLHLKYLRNVTQNILNFITAPKLWFFKLEHCYNQSKTWTNATSLSSFLVRNPSIKVLKITLPHDFIPIIAKHLRSSLEELRTSFQLATDDSIEHLAQYCPNLNKLDLNGAKSVGKDSLIKLFQACTQMVNLDLGYCSRISSPPECEVLWTLPQSLTSLSLCGMMLQDKEILVECITRLPRLTALKLCGVPALTDETLTQIAEKIGNRLLGLNLSGIGVNEITDIGLKAVAKYCTHLEALHISMLREVTGVTLAPIFLDPNRASKITELAANCKKMDVNLLDQIMYSCPNLKILDVSGLNEVTDQMIITLADHSPKLTQLHLKGCKQVTDAAICYLSGCCPLTSMCLSGLHALTDKSIFCLASSCPQLEEIYLNGCANISPVAVQYLKDCCLGRLYVKHNIPNANPNQLMAKNLDTGEFCRADLL
ncbi:F-box/LRR-repeat protein 2-like [Biomphalaria glabrata]|uniref:F-box/LRR-repeat protein 2-like n=1 Tax=Biomphalaria glabrata TaxID=6526 RepID=A0A9W2ZM80_BIOGL|nr:F-box/LRR-repeat protein 2-like [Biomphalaria glabrata]XP_055876186.1 F-box/LRR-repeat protein 2-like [Biomphalaria glabrata]XP_055876188.1 F-box/LRR-repeat protein 2-like [Biomphalaria glabrata]XP_055876198.1 F-box/LRR-repeat protein 2-like [Biomphalaria glabrata]